jgi:hypothetical protein
MISLALSGVRSACRDEPPCATATREDDKEDEAIDFANRSEPGFAIVLPLIWRL